MLLLSYSKYAWVPLWWCIRFGFSLALNGWIFSLRTQGVSRLTNVSSQNPGRREPVSSVQVEDRESWTGLHLLTLPLLRFPLEKTHWSIWERANWCTRSDDIGQFWSSMILQCFLSQTEDIDSGCLQTVGYSFSVIVVNFSPIILLWNMLWNVNAVNKMSEKASHLKPVLWC